MQFPEGIALRLFLQSEMAGAGERYNKENK